MGQESEATLSDPAPRESRTVLDLRARLLIAAAVTVLNLGPEWLEGYTFGWDECWMLGAGLRTHRGEGLTTPVHSSWEDMSEPKYAHMFFWPPLHSWVFAGFLNLGLGIKGALAALTALKAVAGFLGSLGWLHLAARLLPTPAAAAFFALCLSGQFFADGADAGPNHVFFWAFVPWILTAVMHSLRTNGNAGLAAAGVLAALAIGYRFHAAYLIPGLALAVLLLSEGPWLRRLLRAAVVAAPAAATLFGIMLFNAAHKGPASWVTQLDARWEVENLFRRQALTYWFGFGFGLEDALLKLRPSWYDEPFYWFAPWYVLLAAAAAAGVRKLAAAMDPRRMQFLVLTAALSAALVAMLMVISFRAEPAQGWLPVATRRLYSELLPAVGLLWVLMFAEWWTRESRLGARVFLAGLSAALVVLAVRPVFRTLRFDVKRVAAAARDGLGLETPIVRRLRALLTTSPVPHKALFDAPFETTSQFRLDDNLLCERFYHPQQLVNSGSTHDLFVVVVVRTWGDDHQRYWATDLAEAYVKFFGLTKTLERTEDTDDCEIFYGVVPAWTPKPDPAPQAAPTLQAAPAPQPPAR